MKTHDLPTLDSRAGAFLRLGEMKLAGFGGVDLRERCDERVQGQETSHDTSV